MIEGLSTRGERLGLASAVGSLIISLLWATSVVSVVNESSGVTSIVFFMVTLNGLFFSYLCLGSGSIALSAGRLLLRLVTFSQTMSRNEVVGRIHRSHK